MRCEVHCPDGGGALTGVAAVAVLVFVFAAVVSVVAAVVVSAAEAFAVTVLAVCVPAVWVTWRLMKYGDRREVFRRHPRARPMAARAALTRGPLAIEAPKRVVEGVVIKATAGRIGR